MKSCLSKPKDFSLQVVFCEVNVSGVTLAHKGIWRKVKKGP